MSYKRVNNKKLRYEQVEAIFWLKQENNFELCHSLEKLGLLANSQNFHKNFVQQENS